PYISKSIGEFWRRWHITLGSWFRSYVYIPLGGNRKGTLKTLRNLLIVWALTGLWHGANWNFILWGLYFGVLIIIERIGWGKILEKLPSFVSMLYTFILVVFGWVLFDTNTLGDAFTFFKAMFGGNGIAADSTSMYLFVSNIVIFAVCIFASTNCFSTLTAKLSDKKPVLYKAALPAVQLCVMLICTAYLVDATYNPFLYFRF
ncbi:MAG: MBOAT family O-acyltransferase, partial [Oscillospiraceae bacterium]